MTRSITCRPSRLATLAALVLAALVASATARAAEEDEAMTTSDAAAPTTKPAVAPFARRPAGAADFRRGGGDGLLQRLKENVDKLGLTDDQKKELERIAADARDKARQIFADAGGDRDKVRQQMGDVMRDSFQQIREILTPEQQRKLRDIMEQRGGDFRRPTPPKDDETMMDDRRPDAAKPERKRPAADAAPTTPRKEAVDPATVEINRLDGKTVPISTYKGKPLVLIFGSYSSPTFRENAKAIDDLQRHYAVKANFLLVYTREAHPVGGWEVERNKEAEISVQPHKDEAARVTAAKQARTTLGLTIPTAVDSMDDQLASAFDAFPNGCVILDRDGKIIARQKWAEAHGIRTLLDEISSAKAPTSQAAAD